MQISFPTDRNGFLSQECPSCEKTFKVCFGQGSEEPFSFCPYCGHRGRNCWYTKQQITYVQAIAANRVLGPELEKFRRKQKGMSSGLLKFDMKVELPTPGAPPMETGETLDTLCFSCCNETVKLVQQAKHYCIICGKEADMAASDAKKVFLSHRGIDKPEVAEFKETLMLLGYNPWIDEDAMPAGTPLERGLLQGMQDSCAVVFFITPSFKDVGYLEAEINYAIQEKRNKGERFAIITLVFNSADGSAGEIPELLKPYVWKTPKSSLEALREIIRALPIVPKAAEWRQGIGGVVSTSTIKSTSEELSEEAKAILVAAASADEQILRLRCTTGQIIQVGGENLIPDETPRTTALWLGGFEDLLSRRYIMDVSHKGQVFEITREGYEMADTLPKG